MAQAKSTPNTYVLLSAPRMFASFRWLGRGVISRLISLTKFPRLRPNPEKVVEADICDVLSLWYLKPG